MRFLTCRTLKFIRNILAMANINVEVSNELIDNLKELGYEIVRIGNPKDGEFFLSYAASNDKVCKKDIIVAKGNLNYDLRIIIRKILKWPPFLGGDCVSFQLSTGGNYSSTVIFLYDKYENYTTVKLPMLTYDFCEYPVGVRITRKDCAT